MAITPDTSAAVASGANYTMGVGSGGLLFAAIKSASDDITAVTYAGVAMTLVQKIVNIPAGLYVALYSLANPTAGSNAFTVTGGSSLINRLASYLGTAGIVDTLDSHLDIVGSTSVTDTNVVLVANSWILTATTNSNSSTISSTSGVASTNRISTSPGPVLFDTNGTVTAGSKANTYAGTGSPGWASIGVSFQPDNSATFSETVTDTDNLSLTVAATFSEALTLVDAFVVAVTKFTNNLTKHAASWVDKIKD